MILIKHIILSDLGDEKYLLINSLDGRIDKIGQPVVDTLNKWRGLDNIVPENEFETSLYNALLSKGYIINNRAEEEARKNEIISILRTNHQANAKICKAITFILTYDCNFRCPYCYEGEITSKKAIMTPEQIDAALHFAGDSVTTIGLFGGEPLMPSCRSSLEYLISKTRDKSYHITTNGYYLEEFYDTLSPLNITSINVTLDGDEEAHNKRRYLADGSPTYKKVMRGIEKYLVSSIPICIRMNLDNSNSKVGYDLRKHLMDRFSKHSDYLTFEMSPMLTSDYNEKTNIVEELYELNAQASHDDQLRQNQLLGRSSPIMNAITLGKKIHPTYSYCFAHAGNTYLVDPYGYIYPCLIAAGIEDLAIGTYYPEVNLKENSVHDRNIETIPKCRSCEYSLLCGGGCPIRLPSYDDLLKPECMYTRSLIHVMLPKIYKINEAAKTKKNDA